MIRGRSVLLRRHLARLRANRSISIGLAFGAIVLAALVLTAYIGAGGRTDELSGMAFVVQQRFWAPGNLFGGLALVFAIVLGSSMVNDDFKAGTIFGILARPVSRADYFVCSWLGSAMFLVTIELMRCVVSVGLGLSLDGHVPLVSLVAMFAVLAGDVLRLTLFAALGAMFSTGAAVFAGLSLFFVEVLSFAPKVPSWIAYPLRAVAVLAPLSSYQEATIVKRLTGAARDAAPLVEVIGYRLCWTTALLLLGIWIFHRREVAPRI